MDFYLGGTVAPDGSRTGDRLVDDASHLTTHGVIVGMTGSGKTGLGVIYLEEALRNGIPCLVIDPKGDMTNLALTFPDLAPGDFLPWIDTAAATRDGVTPEDVALAEATKWREGLAGWDLSGSDIGALRETVEITIYTPGSHAGVPVDVVGDLSAPSLSWETEAETIRAEIQGFVSGLLGLVDIDADPISSREHILLANLVEHSWALGRDLSLEQLINEIVVPPIRKLGVFDVDTFFPERDRMQFAMQLNGLLASPSFASWMSGEPLDIEAMLWRDGRPQAAIVYLAHLSDAERQFVVTTVLGKLITWMRSQPGSGDLRVLAYMDEVFGFVPPTANPPAKQPILTLLKQARAFGVGMLLSTQNPVDLDYKAMSNAGTWCIGRLQTERDKARIVEALQSASGDTDVADLDTRISGLGKRTFLMHSTRRGTPSLFTTRWAMSYLRGPMTREEIAVITEPERRATEPKEASMPAADQRTVPGPPAVADGVDVRALHPAASWGAAVGFDPDGDHYEAAIAVAVDVRFDESRIDLDHTMQWEAVATDLSKDPSTMTFLEVDHDPRDFLDPAEGGTYVAPDAPISQQAWFADVARTVRDRLDRDETLTLRRHRALGLVSRPGETDADFAVRVAAAARDRADTEMATLRDRYATKLRKTVRDHEEAVRDATAAGEALDDAQQDAIVGAGLDFLMGRKPRLSSSSRRTAERRLTKAENAVDAARARYEDVERDLEDDLRAIEDKWVGDVEDLETITVGLESDDISTPTVTLVWVRRRSTP